MRLRPPARAVITVVCWIAVGWSITVRQIQAADIVVGSTLLPTSSLLTTTSYLPTSYVFPTSTILPTASILEPATTSYLPTGYISTYRGGGLFRPRRFVERTSYYSSPTTFLTPTIYTPTVYSPTSYVATSSYFPTSYVVPSSTYFPTTYLSRSTLTPTSYLVDDGIVATSVAVAAAPSPCTESSSSPSVEATPTRAIAPRAMSPSATPGRTIYSQQGGASSPVPTERTPSSQVRPEIDAEAPPAAPVPPVANPRVEAAPKTPAPTDAGTPPGGERPIDSGPALPEPGSLGKPSTDEGINRTSYRPSYNLRTSTRNILRGRVVSFETGRPEEAVRLVLASKTGQFEDRVRQTDADGEFKISLPDGDWLVKVTMPSGSVYTLGQTMTASAGHVTDRNGKSIGELIITR